MSDSFEPDSFEPDAPTQPAKPRSPDYLGGMLGMMGARTPPGSSAAQLHDQEEAARHNTIKDAIQGVLKGASLSFNDELHGVTQALIDKAFGTGKPGVSSYEVGRDAARADEAASARRSPTAFTAGELGGAVLTPLPIKGAGVANTAGNASLMSAANSLGDSEKLDEEALKRAAVAGGVGAGAGLGLGVAAKGAGALARAGAGMAGRAQGKIDAEVAQKMAESLGSTRGKAAQVNQEIRSGDRTLRDYLEDPRIDDETKQAIAAAVDTDDAKFLVNRAARNLVEKYKGLGSRVEDAELAHADNASYWADQGAKDAASQIENRSNMWDALYRAGKPLAGMALGGAVGHLVGHDAAGLGVGALAGALHGKPATILGNAVRQPGFQKALGNVMESAGSTAAEALTSPATAEASQLSRAPTNSLREYLELLKEQEQTP